MTAAGTNMLGGRVRWRGDPHGLGEEHQGQVVAVTWVGETRREAAGFMLLVQDATGRFFEVRATATRGAFGQQPATVVGRQDG